MKKSTFTHLLIVTFVLLSAVESHAQFKVGVRGGVNVANFKPNAIFDYDNRVGVNVALLFNKTLNSKLSIQFEPGLSQRGAQYDYVTEGPVDGKTMKTEETGKFLLNFIEMPVLVQWKPRIGKFTGIVSLGPEVRYRVGNARQKYTSKITYDGVVSKDESGVVDMQEGFGKRAFDYGIAGGVGVAYPMKSVAVFTEARYHLGLRPVVKSLNMYHRGPSFHLGVLVPLKK
ncbi:porin family protein [Dyadobacter sp. OTU695]|uniref:porin family protein n=1 Tax=Dyadobacter sp. OTU695 TaxID=3043860 RepID=UPI00313EA154